MPIRLEWGNPEHSILLEIVEGEWTLVEVYQMLDDIYDMIIGLPHRVDIIADMSHAKFSTTNLLSALGHVQRRQPPNAGMLVVVRANSYLRSIADIARKVAPKALIEIRFVDSLEEAYAEIQHRRKQ